MPLSPLFISHISALQNKCPKALYPLAHFPLRHHGIFSPICSPPYFSFLFLAALIYLYIPSKSTSEKLSPFKTLAIIIIMLLWANTHIFFPLGIVFLSLVILARFLESRFIDHENDFDRSQFLLPIIAFLPTLINPWGAQIWAYIDRLRNCPVNQLAPEMVPVNLMDWQNPDTIYLLLILSDLCPIVQILSYIFHKTIGHCLAITYHFCPMHELATFSIDTGMQPFYFSGMCRINCPPADQRFAKIK